MTSAQRTYKFPPNNEYTVRLRVAGRVYRETCYCPDLETAWGWAYGVQSRYEREFDRSVSIVGVSEVK